MNNRPTQNTHTKPILTIKSLNKSYGALKVTDNVSCDLYPGEIHTLIGPNGAGKSTLIGQIAGWIKPDSGAVYLDDINISKMSVSKRSRLGLGRSFQVSSLAMELTARRNVMLAVQARQGSSFRFWKAVESDQSLIDEADKILMQLHIDEFQDVIAAELSHGKRRELEVACAMALQPKVLLLDEPMAGLDPASTEALVDFLLQLKLQIPILLIEHDMDAVFKLSDRISVLVYGNIIFSGTPEEIQNSNAVKQAYLGDDKENTDA